MTLAFTEEQKEALATLRHQAERNQEAAMWQLVRWFERRAEKRAENDEREGT